MLKDILKTLFIGMLPVLEIRGAIPVGVAAGLDPWSAFFVGFVGNMLPVPFLILLTRKIIEWMKKHHILDKLTSFLERKGSQKAQTVQKYSFWGLFILVAIPLPGTGAWTGALVATVFRCPPLRWASSSRGLSCFLRPTASYPPARSSDKYPNMDG